MVKHAVILAGGSGTRLWPASRSSFPKQFLDIGMGKSLIETEPECSPGYLVASFHEKPDMKTAKEYIDKGNFYWNAGIFTFKVKALMEAMSKDAPEVAKRFAELLNPYLSRSERRALMREKAGSQFLNWAGLSTA